MAGIKDKSMRDIPILTPMQRFQSGGLLGLLAGPSPQEEAIAQAYSQFRQGLQPTTVNAGPLQGGYVPLEQGQQQAGQADYAGLLNHLLASGPQGLEQAKQLAATLGMGKGQGSQGSKYFGNVQYTQDPQGGIHAWVIDKQTAQPTEVPLPGHWWRIGFNPKPSCSRNEADHNPNRQENCSYGTRSKTNRNSGNSL